jgi:TRAP-type C4-dicarboxylate transport system permease large subunit
MRTWNSPTHLFGYGLVLVALTVAAFAVAGDLGSGLVCGAIVLVYLLAVLAGRRHSQTAEVLSGIGDERTRNINLRATAFAGSVMAFVLPVIWLVSVAAGSQNTTAAACSGGFGAAYIAAAAFLARRS